MASASGMIVKATIPAYGGKRTLAPAVVEELGPHTQYFEPFCLSMAILFAKPASQKETVNDLYGYATNLALVLQHRPLAEALYERLQRVLFCQGLLEAAQQQLALFRRDLPAGHPVDQDVAFYYFIASWMGRNGTSGTDREDYQICVRWTKNGGSPTVRWRHAIASIPWWHDRLRNVCILRRDAFELIPKFEDVAGTAIYLDPPYTASSRSRMDGCGRYVYEFKPEDHRRLCKMARRFKKARVVISYYDCPEIRRLYDGWTFVCKTRHKHLAVVGSRARGKKECPEVLVINGPSYGQQPADAGM